MPTRAKIAGIGVCVPDRIVTNHDLAKRMDTSDEWIRTRTGISERRMVAENDPRTASYLGAEASRNALERAGMTSDQIDCIICGTFTPDYTFPSTACLIQEKIGAQNATAFDITAACSGFVYGLALADSLIQCDKHKNVLLVGTELISRVLDWDDRSTAVLFGDGAGAVVIVPGNKKSCVLATYTRTDGSLAGVLSLPGWGDDRHVNMNGSEVFKHAVRRMAESAQQVVRSAGCSVDDVNWLVPHQANIRIIQAVANHLKIPREKLIVNVDKYGNTSSASIPLALMDGVDDGRIQQGDLVVMVAFGGGLTWGAAAVRW